MSQTFAPTATYGSNAVKNRVKIGGALGSNQYFYKTNAKTGTVEINRYEVNNKTGKVTETSIGNIPQGGKFIPNSDASSAEKSHYSSPRAVGKVRAQALQVAQREWDGKTQPPPTQAIYGTNSGNSIGFTPAGSGTPSSSTQGIQDTGSGSNSNTFSNVANRSGLNNNLRDLGAGGVSNILGGGLGLNPLSGGLRGISGLGGNKSSGRSGSGTVIVYPTTLRRTGNAQDYIQIDRLKYEPKKRSGGDTMSDALSGWGSRNSNRKGDGTVILPIPGGISDSNAVSWGADKMGPVEPAMADLALSGIEGGGKELANTAAAMGDKIKNNSKEVKDAISKGMAGMASGTGAQLLTRTTGQIMNPNMELLFKDPSLRPFTFTWKLAARSREEANSIIRIINFFKRGMAPKNDGGNLFLGSPNTWRLTYMHRGRPHNYLNKFKECAMTSFTTQYTPDGNYATFETGHMVAYSITMALQELEPVFSSDYNSDNEIGY